LRRSRPAAIIGRVMPRLFIALDLPEPIKERLEWLCHGVDGARWVRDRQFHLTLSFLGEVPGPAAEELRQGLAGVRGDPFEMRLEGLGAFPPRGTPRVLWIGAEPRDAIHELHEKVESRLKRLGFPGETRRFAPHVTLARLRQPARQVLLRYIEAHAQVTTEPFAVTDFQLFSSVLGKAGPHHRIEASYPLFAARAG
jgi:2'-5' RNA ligase